MQVAMRLGPYWWEKLKKKRVSDGFSEKEVWRCNQYGVIFLGTAMALASLAIYTINIYGINKIMSHPRSGLPMMILSAITIVIAGVGIINLIVAGVALVKALVATLRFRTIFGFSPPVTDEGHKAVQLAVDRVLAFRAIALAKEYLREKEVVENIRENKSLIASFGDQKEMIQSAAKNVTHFEHNIEKLEKSKKRAKKEFYSARDAAQEEFLPKPFVVRKSFKDYLPKEMLQKLSQEEKQ